VLKPEVTEPRSEGIHVYTFNEKVWVDLGSEGLPADCGENSGLTWSDEYFRGDCSSVVWVMEMYLKNMGVKAFNEWLSCGVNKKHYLSMVRQRKRVNQGKVIQRLVITGGDLEMDGK
jgi:hypothetical protein